MKAVVVAVLVSLAVIASVIFLSVAIATKTTTVDASKPFVFDKLVYEITSVKVERLNVKEFGSKPMDYYRDLLVVRFKIQNTTENMRLYHSQFLRSGSKSKYPQATDEFGNRYECAQEDFDINVSGQLDPGESTEDLIAMDIPVNSAKQLTIALSYLIQIRFNLNR